MSELRICDNPGHIGDKLSRIFSTESEGWSSGTLGVRRFNNRTGRLEVKDVAQDSCPECMDRISGTRVRIPDEIEPPTERAEQ